MSTSDELIMKIRQEYNACLRRIRLALLVFIPSGVVATTLSAASADTAAEAIELAILASSLCVGVFIVLLLVAPTIAYSVLQADFRRNQSLADQKALEAAVPGMRRKATALSWLLIAALVAALILLLLRILADVISC